MLEVVPTSLKCESERQVVLCRRSCVAIRWLLCDRAVVSIHACCPSALDLFRLCLVLFPLPVFWIFFSSLTFSSTLCCVCCVSRNHTDTDLHCEVDLGVFVVFCGYCLLLLCFDPVLKLSAFFLSLNIIFRNGGCFFCFCFFF